MTIQYEIFSLNKKDKSGNTVDAMLFLNDVSIIQVTLDRKTYQPMISQKCKLGFGCKYIECDLEDILLIFINAAVSGKHKTDLKTLNVVERFIVHPDLSRLIQKRRLEEQNFKE